MATVRVFDSHGEIARFELADELVADLVIPSWTQMELVADPASS